MINKYPIYVISKGRYDNILTAKALEKMDAEYYVVIEPQEYEAYAQKINRRKLIKTPFQDLGQGSIPVRNFVRERSQSYGFSRHWVLDDNIREFLRLNYNKKIKVETPSIFRAAEEFTDRYTNVALSGFNYRQFADQSRTTTPFRLNTRIYSCILFNNQTPFSWRGLYNEDTDLSLRLLKEGWCTILFDAFLCDKMRTMTMSGGNTDEVYLDQKRYDFAESLRKKHPNHVKVVWRYGRWHHHVDYSKFNQKLKKRNVLSLTNQVNEYGMKLVKNQ